MQPLDVHNWLAWKQQFQVFLASKDHLEDYQKVEIFLDSLGADGLAIAFRLDPELVYYNSTYLSVTFDQVWWQFNEHCLSMKGQQTDPAKDLLKDRANLQLICDQEKDEVEHPTLLKLIPMLSMCELEFVSRKIPSMERVVRNFAQLFGVQIEPCCLQNHQIGIDESIYIIHGLIVSSLTLKRLPESDAGKIFPFFRRIKHFRMENMKIVEDISEFPSDLVELTLINCQIEDELSHEWFYDIGTTLRRLHLDNFESFIDYLRPHSNSCRYLELDTFELLQSLTLKSKFWCTLLEMHNLEFVTIISGGEGTFEIVAPQLRCLHLEMVSECPMSFRAELPRLQCAVLGNWETFCRLQERALTSVEEVEILSDVDPKHKAEIDSMTVKVRANYWHIAEPPQEPNLIFDMLNYDCLLQIISDLDTNAWMNFGRLHPNAEMVVTTYKYPRARMNCRDFIETGMFAEDRDHFKRISKLVQNLELDEYSTKFCTDWRDFVGAFENLITLYLGKISADLFDVLPCGLDTLVLGHANFDDTSMAAYMRKLNPTLRSLKISDFQYKEHLNMQCLAELHNLEKISIKVPLQSQDLKILLEQNAQSLERLSLTFAALKDGGWRLHEEVLKLIGTLSNVKELAIYERDTDTETTTKEMENGHLLTDVLRSVGPKLNKLTLMGNGKGIGQLLNLECLKDLPELTIEPYWDFEDVPSILRHLTGLRTLDFNDKENNYERIDNVGQDSGLIALIESLPNLRELKHPCFNSTFKLEMELRQRLKQVNRTLRINSVQF